MARIDLEIGEGAGRIGLKISTWFASDALGAFDIALSKMGEIRLEDLGNLRQGELVAKHATERAAYQADNKSQRDTIRDLEERLKQKGRDCEQRINDVKEIARTKN